MNLTHTYESQLEREAVLEVCNRLGIREIDVFYTSETTGHGVYTFIHTYYDAYEGVEDKKVYGVRFDGNKITSIKRMVRNSHTMSYDRNYFGDDGTA